MTPARKAEPALQPMNVAGLMSGTSGDGVDVAIVRIEPAGNSAHHLGNDPENIRLELLGYESFPFSRGLRLRVLDAMGATSIATAELARLNWRLGQAYAEALEQAQRRIPCRLDLIGCHGQTVYHQARPRPYAGRAVACTWQIGEMAMLAAQGGAPVVSNFRPADMAAGGEGAPLVPMLDYALFRHPRKGRVLQNLGGIGNLTAIPPGARPSQVMAFDTGPGNMVIDRLMQRLFQREFDRNGNTAGRGVVLDSVAAAMLRGRFFRMAPPKSAGREQFGRAYAERLLAACRRARAPAKLRPEDAIATATALTARSLRQAYAAFVQPRMGRATVEWIVSGGGARNSTLLRMIRRELQPLGCAVLVSDEVGLPAQAKEAAAFALLAYLTWHRRPGNLPAATGARSPVILGQVTYPQIAHPQIAHPQIAHP